MKELKTKLALNLKAEAALLTEDVTHTVGSRNVMAGCYAVVSIPSFSTRSIQFDYEGKGYTYYCSGLQASEEGRLLEGRSTGRAGFSRDEKVYRVSKKICKELFGLYNERMEILKTAREEIRAFIRSERAVVQAA